MKICAMIFLSCFLMLPVIIDRCMFCVVMLLNVSYAFFFLIFFASLFVVIQSPRGLTLACLFIPTLLLSVSNERGLK